MITKKIGVLILFCGILLIACIPQQESVPGVDQQVQAQNTPDVVPLPEVNTLPIAVTACVTNADCPEGKLCIDQNCTTLNALYDTSCNNKCQVTAAEIFTSDGETYTLHLGESSYTAAGAIAWKLVHIPEYCPSQNVPLAIEIQKKTTGKIISTEVITLRKGETSTVIKHPSIPRISFTVTLKNIEQRCS